ncbi:MAG: glutamyl-tRNA amidotransferase [Gammaproteobacteria bacterium]|nr:glutamyl-tRNA amidotransferase [Gammaproteobacteria bacterium]|tara:strand:+ start:987 stop:1439 length:453 start_codon:yes stop_codon:yes gene_type:complete
MSKNSIKNKIKLDLVDFMKSGEREKVDIIRFVMSFLNQAEKDKKSLLTDTEILQILKKLIKKNEDSFEQFTKAERNDLADKEKREMDFIKNYLPAEMDENETINLIKESIKNTEATSIKDMGKVMSDIKEHNDGSVDMSLVSKHVKNLLS